MTNITVDEIFASVVRASTIDPEMLARSLKNRFVTPHYPSSGTVGTRVNCVPPNFPQFKGRLSTFNEVWFDRLYLDFDIDQRCFLESKPSDTWLHINRSLREGDAEEIIGKPVNQLIRRGPIPDHILVEGVQDWPLGPYPGTRLDVTPLKRVPLPMYRDEQAADAEITDLDGFDFHKYLELTHIEVAAWRQVGHDWTRDGIHIHSHEVAEINVANHATPGATKTIPALTVKVPYDKDKARSFGAMPGTFFDRPSSSWMIPLSTPANIAGQMLWTWSVLILPNGRFMQKRHAK